MWNTASTCPEQISKSVSGTFDCVYRVDSRRRRLLSDIQKGCLYKESRGEKLVVGAVWSCGKRGRGPVFQGLWEGPKELSIGRQIPQPSAPCS